jgi:hypothetical protein
MKIQIQAKANTKLTVELRVSEKPENYTPEVVLEQLEIEIEPGEHFYSFSFQQSITVPQYVFVTFINNPELNLKCSNTRITGLLSVFNKFNKSVATSSRQDPPSGIGIDSFEFWVPERRPQGQNLAFELAQPLHPFKRENIRNGIFRPTTQPNSWVAALKIQILPSPWIGMKSRPFLPYIFILTQTLTTQWNPRSWVILKVKFRFVQNLFR